MSSLRPPDHTHGKEPCGLCRDAGKVTLMGRCHVNAPMRAEYDNATGVLTLYCYVPECSRVVAKFKVAGILQ